MTTDNSKVSLVMPPDAAGVGAVQKELKRYTLRGMVVGGYGEGSPMIHKLLHFIAKAMAAKHFARLGYDNQHEARPVCSRKVMREFATAAAVQQAMLIHDRVDKLELRQMPSCRGSRCVRIPQPPAGLFHAVRW